MERKLAARAFQRFFFAAMLYAGSVALIAGGAQSDVKSSDRAAASGWDRMAESGGQEELANSADGEPDGGLVGTLHESYSERQQTETPNTSPSTTNVSQPYSPTGIGQSAPIGKPQAAPKNPAATAYKGVFYDNDFKYLNAPQNQENFLGDQFKQVSIGECWTVDVGGEYRMRQHHEVNLVGSNLSNSNENDFLLQRTRLYTNVRWADSFRFFGEAIDATSSFENFPPRTIEENRFDSLNLFVDGLLTDPGNGQLWGRAGRQELLYGEQRLISPLDWANTRRTFDGAKIYWRAKDWDVDGFWVRPVPFSQHVNDDHNFDHPNSSQEFIGLYSSNKGHKDYVYDLYFLRLADDSAASFNANTFGARWKSKCECWLIDAEGGYQFGDFGPRRQSAGFATVGLGHEWADLPWKPVIWQYFDWASGDADPTDSVRGTFNQLFPLGHKYFGFADLVGRQNIQDLNLQFTAKPSQKINLLIWWHVFHLAQARDSLYNANGTPIRTDLTGAAGTYVGQELDFTAQYSFDARRDVLFGYSHFYAGSFVKNTNPPGVTGDVDFVYTQFSWKY